MGKNENKGFDSPVRLRLISYRWKLADTDGISAKAAIDGLVKKGLLKDDSTLYVKEVTYAQVKIRHNQKEKTVIEIWGDVNDVFTLNENLNSYDASTSGAKASRTTSATSVRRLRGLRNDAKTLSLL